MTYTQRWACGCGKGRCPSWGSAAQQGQPEQTLTVWYQEGTWSRDFPALFVFAQQEPKFLVVFVSFFFFYLFTDRKKIWKHCRKVGRGQAENHLPSSSTQQAPSGEHLHSPLLPQRRCPEGSLAFTPASALNIILPPSLLRGNFQGKPQ